MCLCGVDYFSTLGYQPSIAFDGAGTLSPIATILLVLVTLLGALPVYRYVAGETPDGVGSVGMIERLFRGWTGKIAVLVLIGFAATDFVQTKGYCTDVFFDAAMEWIDKSRQREEPFFCFITPNAPHGPLDEPPGSAEPYANQVPQDVAKFYGMIENIDTNIGRLLERLELWKLSEKTLVIFTTDNGTATGAKVFNDGMRASKGSPYRGGTRVPAFWRWKGVLSEGIDVPALTAHIDVLPTLCELAGVTIESQVAKTIEGRSLVPLLIDAQAMWPQRHLVTHAGRWDRGPLSVVACCFS